MRTRCITSSALLLIVLGSGCKVSAAAVSRSTDAPVRGVAGNCPAGTGPMRPVGTGAAVDLNHDGYGCARSQTSIAVDQLRRDVDNDASSAGAAEQHAPVWRALYTGM